MTHIHQFQEIPLTIYRDKNVVHYRCLECKALFAIPLGEEWKLNGEIVDERDEPEKKIRTEAQLSAAKKNSDNYKKSNTAWTERCILNKKGE